jgi:hypothetical protein
MDEDTILVLLYTRLQVADLHQTTLIIDCVKWDKGLGLLSGSTARYIHALVHSQLLQYDGVSMWATWHYELRSKAIEGTGFSIALRGNRTIKLSRSLASPGLI